MKLVSNNTPNADFFIKRVGNAGQPSLTPLTANNSWGVISNNPAVDFQRIDTAYNAGAFRVYKRGSVQPFITKRDAQIVIEKCSDLDEEKLKMLASIQKLVELTELKADKLKELLKAHQHNLFNS